MKNYLKICWFHIKTNRISLLLCVVFTYGVILPLVISYMGSGENDISLCHNYMQKLLFVPYVLSVIQLYKIYIDAEYKDILLSISQSTRLKYLLFDNILWIMIWIPMFIYLYVQNSLFYISIVYIIIQQFLFMSLIYLLTQISLSSLFVSGITIIYILICSFATNDIPVISYMHDIIPYVLDFSYLFSMILISVLCLVGGYVIEKYTYRFLK